ncbi:MAG: hypothetical protein V7745_03675 [Pseudomonadales bacterium]
MNKRAYDLFLSVLSNDNSAIDQISTYNGSVYIEQGALVFSLTDLFDFLSQSCEDKIDYAEFQRQLYQSTLNQDLKAHGGQVVVHRSTGKVETNLYRLERLPVADNSL